MSLLRSTFRDAACAALVFGACLVPSSARGQACCAGTSAVTPGRLELHEDALVGLQARASTVLGQYDYLHQGRFVPSPSGDLEYDFEQDLFGAVRFLRRGQAALLVPLDETMRATPQDGSHVGAGIGDINLSGRYDAVLAGQYEYVPGVAFLAGITLPTGTPTESATAPLAVDATGTGLVQGTLALALEQTFGPWLVNATGSITGFSSRFGTTLAPQGTLLLAGAYTFPNDAALALAASYAFQRDATGSDGKPVPSSSTRLATITLSALYPFASGWRLLGGLSLDPPIDALGYNKPAHAGLFITVIRSWF